MAKHHDLDRFGPITAAQQDQELKDTPEDEVEGGPEHRQQDARDLIMLEPRTPRPTTTAEFPHPTGLRGDQRGDQVVVVPMSVRHSDHHHAHEIPFTVVAKGGLSLKGSLEDSHVVTSEADCAK